MEKSEKFAIDLFWMFVACCVYIMLCWVSWRTARLHQLHHRHRRSSLLRCSNNITFLRHRKLTMHNNRYSTLLHFRCLNKRSAGAWRLRNWCSCVERLNLVWFSFIWTFTIYLVFKHLVNNGFRCTRCILRRRWCTMVLEQWHHMTDPWVTMVWCTQCHSNMCLKDIRVDICRVCY